jgi:hypothetical protein
MKEDLHYWIDEVGFMLSLYYSTADGPAPGGAATPVAFTAVVPHLLFNSCLSRYWGYV